MVVPSSKRNARSADAGARRLEMSEGVSQMAAQDDASRTTFGSLATVGG